MPADPRTLQPYELASVIREQLPDEWVPYVDELERAWLCQWAKVVLGRGLDD